TSVKSTAPLHSTGPSSSKCSLVFYHRDHKERREVADLRLICRFFVFSVLFVVECVLHLELLHRPALDCATAQLVLQ
ncbi:MAG: hypothetical protein WAV60_00325, partial [Anaerolineae bacterium]